MYCGKTAQGCWVKPSMAGVKMLLVSGDVRDNKRGVEGSACNHIPKIFPSYIGGCWAAVGRLDRNKGKRACDWNNTSQEADPETEHLPWCCQRSTSIWAYSLLKRRWTYLSEQKDSNKKLSVTCCCQKCYKTTTTTLKARGWAQLAQLVGITIFSSLPDRLLCAPCRKKASCCVASC